MIQIRHVPEALHKRLRTRAALAGMTLSDYLRQELAAIADSYTYDELRDRLGELPQSKVAETSAAVLRRERDAK